MASWAQSFERLLQDPRGLAYFTVSPGVGWNRGGRVPLQEEGAGEDIDRASGWLECCFSLWSLSLASFPSSPSWELSLLVLISVSYFLPVPQIWHHLSVCLVSWPPCLSQSLNTFLKQPVSEGLPSPYTRSS